MKIDTDMFRVRAGDKLRLGKRPTLLDPYYGSNERYKELLAKDVQKMRGLQNRLYASNSHSILLILQAMDSAGKDGVIKRLWVMSVPFATPESIGVSTVSQRDGALKGQGLPWLMLAGTAGAHVMIPINQ